MADDSIVAEYRINVDATKKALDDVIARLSKVEQEGKSSADRLAKEQERAAQKAAAAIAREAQKAAKEQERAANQAARAAEKAAKESETAQTRAARQAAIEAQKAAQAQAKAAQEAARAQAKAAQEASNAQKKAAAEAAQAYKNQVNSIKEAVSGVAGSLGLAFGAGMFVNAIKESVELAGKVEGVEIAFKRLNDPQLLGKLRAATNGTVSDLNLMTAAVRASNFKIPMEQMGTLLEFARRRAKETGESIDYLVESIVVGIGRKSPLILDNLGISAIELRKRFKGISIEAAEVGDVAKIVGDIATDELKNMGDEALTTGDKIAKLKADWDNWTVSVGQALIVIAEYYGILEDRRPAQIIAAQRADEHAQALARVRSALKDLATEEEKKAKLDELSAKNSENNAKALQALSDIEERRASLVAQITEAEQKAEAFRNGARQFKGEAQRAEQLKAQLAELQKLAEAERFSLAMSQAYLQVIKEIIAEYAKGGTAEVYIDNLINIGETVKGLSDELQKLPVFTEEWIAKFKELDKANMRLQAAKNLVENLKDDIEKPEETDFVKVMADEMPAHLQYLLSLEKENEDAMRALREQRVKDGLAELDAMDSAREEAHQKELARQENEARFRQEGLNAIGELINLNLSLQLSAIDAEQTALDRQFKNKEITEAQYQQRQLQLRRKAAQAQKDAATFNAITGTATAIINALQTQPFPVALGLAAIAAAMGAAQITAIQSQPLPQFEKGGWVDGKLHSQGGTPIEAEKGEFIINRKSASKHAPLLEAINEDRIPEPRQGWDNLIQSIKLQNAFNDRNLLSAIDRHRESDKDGIKYMTSAIVQAVKGATNSRRRWN